MNGKVTVSTAKMGDPPQPPLYFNDEAAYTDRCPEVEADRRRLRLMLCMFEVVRNVSKAKSSAVRVPSWFETGFLRHQYLQCRQHSRLLGPAWLTCQSLLTSKRQSPLWILSQVIPCRRVDASIALWVIPSGWCRVLVDSCLYEWLILLFWGEKSKVTWSFLF